MIRLGEINTLEVLRRVSIGLYLGDEEQDVLLPIKYVPKDAHTGSQIEVFVYRDNEERLIATTRKPKITLHTFAVLEAKQITEHGAFMDMGIEKDLFVPFAEQKFRMFEGEKYIVYLYIDDETGRLTGSSYIYKYVNNEEITVKEGEEVDLLVANQTDLGYNVIINQIHKGLIFKNDIFTKLYYGQRRRGFIHKVREDNKINIRLQNEGYKKIIEPTSQKILNLLEKNNDFLALTDKSKPEEIYELLGMSKKNFKKAIGNLYQQRIIEITKKGIAKK